MTADVALSRELKSLEEEVAASQRMRPTPPTDIALAGSAATDATNLPKNAGEHQQLQAEFRDFVSTITGFFEDAETSVATHPTASVTGAMVVGILIGRLLGRR